MIRCDLTVFTKSLSCLTATHGPDKGTAEALPTPEQVVVEHLSRVPS